MKEQKGIFFITILKKATEVYFNTFFVFYFFQVANYEVLPVAKYYITLYFFTGLGFFLIKSAMKRNERVPYFRIGISLQALYIALIMLLKENIVNWIFLVGLVQGMADGFYYYPKNILDSEKISNEGRQKYSGIVNTISKVIGIVVPIVLGTALTFLSYTDVGKVFFCLFVIMFGLSFMIKEDYRPVKNFKLKEYLKLVKTNEDIKRATIVSFMSGLTYSSGVMGTIITLLKINSFKTNLNLGFVDSACAAMSLLICVLFAIKIKDKHFKSILYVSGALSLGALVTLGIIPNTWTLIFYLFVRFSCVELINLISQNKAMNLSNVKELKRELKVEYYLVRDLVYAISRCTGYAILILVCVLFGMDYINYILIIPGLSLALEALLVAKIRN